MAWASRGYLGGGPDTAAAIKAASRVRPLAKIFVKAVEAKGDVATRYEKGAADLHGLAKQILAGCKTDLRFLALNGTAISDKIRDCLRRMQYA